MSKSKAIDLLFYDMCQFITLQCQSKQLTFSIYWYDMEKHKCISVAATG